MPNNLPKRKRTSVRSSNIAAIGYYADSHTLEVEFHDGSIYHYYGVPESVFVEFMNAPSHGKFLHQRIHYPYERVGIYEDFRKRRAQAVDFRIHACQWCFDLLDISNQADLEEVRKAYHKKAKLFHPDSGGDEAMMKKVNEAYNLIKQSRGVRRNNS